MSIQHQQRWLILNPAKMQAILDSREPYTAHDKREIRDWYSLPVSSLDPTRYWRMRHDSLHGTTITVKRPLEHTQLRQRRQCGGVVSFGVIDEETMGPPHITKTRYELNPEMGTSNMHLNVFQGAYAGLMILEWNDPPANAEERLRKAFPEIQLYEVTDSLTSAHIACLPALNNMGENLQQVHASIANDVKMIVITGSPCSGKSTLLNACADKLGYHVVPEVATILIAQLKVQPFGAAGHGDRFQISLRRTQLAFEALARSEARAKGCKRVLLDRGTLDGAAYVQDGLAGFHRLHDIHPEREMMRYYGVIQMATPPQAVYEANKGNNSARSETYAQTSELGRRIEQAWKRHRRYHLVDGSTWEEKRANAFKKLDEIERQL